MTVLARCGNISLTVILLTTAACGGGGSTPNAPPTPTVTAQSITVSPASSSIELGTAATALTATVHYSDGSSGDVTASATWTSADSSVATVDSSGNVEAAATGSTSVTATFQSVSATDDITVTAPGHFLMADAGLYTQFDERGATSGYWSGDVLHRWNQVDPVVGTLVSDEVASQLDHIHALGINTITFELRSADPTNSGSFTPPDCTIPLVLGLQYPQPDPADLTNLKALLDMLQARHMKMWLRLVNTHMQEQPPTDNQTWISAILNGIGNHPALDAVLFDGTPHTVVQYDSSGNAITVCGTPAEPPLWLGPGSVAAVYVQWVIGYAMSLGMPASKLSAEAIVGDYNTQSEQPAGSDATDNHLWPPIKVEKTIFDNLGITETERTYALSLYEHNKCDNVQVSCSDMSPQDWADHTITFVQSTTGANARIIAPEMGISTPVDTTVWTTPHALESLIYLIHKHRIDGGSFWRWTSFDDSEDSDTTLATPVKVRGVAYDYNPVKAEVVDMAGYHLPMVPNGSFEYGTMSTVDDWTIAGSGTGVRYDLTQESGEPEAPSRGTWVLRLTTGANVSDTVSATSAMIPVQPGTNYTTTSNDRFSWSGDPNPGASSASRPQVSIGVLYFQADKTPSAVRTGDSFPYFQEDSTTGFATFPVQYTTPSDAAYVQLVLTAARNGLPTPITFDVDNVR